MDRGGFKILFGLMNPQVVLFGPRRLHLNTGNFSSLQLSVQSNFMFAFIALLYTAVLYNLVAKFTSLTIIFPHQWKAKPNAVYVSCDRLE